MCSKSILIISNLMGKLEMQDNMYFLDQFNFYSVHTVQDNHWCATVGSGSAAGSICNHNSIHRGSVYSTGPGRGRRKSIYFVYL